MKPQPPIPVLIAGKPSAESDRALAHAFAALLERKHPGTRWRVERRTIPTVRDTLPGHE